jgi:hypothetical protein
MKVSFRNGAESDRFESSENVKRTAPVRKRA